MCARHAVTLLWNKTAYLKVEKSAQTTFRFSPVRYHSTLVVIRAHPQIPKSRLRHHQYTPWFYRPFVILKIDCQNIYFVLWHCMGVACMHAAATAAVLCQLKVINMFIKLACSFSIWFIKNTKFKKQFLLQTKWESPQNQFSFETVFDWLWDLVILNYIAA